MTTTTTDILSSTIEYTAAGLSRSSDCDSNMTGNVTTGWNGTGLTVDCVNSSNISTTLTIEELLEASLGARSQDLPSAVLLLVIYGLIFISGTVGNICTCIVIVRNSNMQTTTNYYLFSLAISDVLILLFALPSEAYSILEAYPWRFGEVFCYIKASLQEMTSYASVLTITAFTVERYVAICHPLKAHEFADLSRCVKVIIAIWIIALLCALPYPLHTEVFYFIPNVNGTPVAESRICNIATRYLGRMAYIFQLSTFLFFVFPMSVITVLYLLIALALRRAALQRVASSESGNSSGQNVPSCQSRKAVLRMLVAVVVAFFICWAPFHSQRLLTIYNRKWTPLLLTIQSTLFYISGVLYFVGSTVNPILYNVMSMKYREAFKETIWGCKRKRSAFTRGSSFHQVYFHSSRRHVNSSSKKTVSDHDDAHASHYTNNRSGKTPPENEDYRVHLLQELPELRSGRKFYDHVQKPSDQNRNAVCSACTSDLYSGRPQPNNSTFALENEKLLSTGSSTQSDV